MNPRTLCLPAGRLHNLGERCAVLALEQAQDRGLLAAVARTRRLGGVFAGLGVFGLGSLGRLRLRRFLGALRGRRGRLRCVGRFPRASSIEALNRFLDPRDCRLAIGELFHRR
jgi:hypothetical protein